MNQNKKGKLFVIEGGDGTGKTDQFQLLIKRLNSEGYKVSEVDFPRYGNPPIGNPASFSIRKYLQKEEFGFFEGYGPASNVNPYGASLLYALDRFDASFCHEQRPNLWDLLNEGYMVVSNRYTQSNIGYQASKIEGKEERAKFINWLMDLEYNVLKIPEPNLVLLLDLEPDIARALKAQQRKEQGQSLDAHERNNQILDRARESYLDAAQLFPNSWKVIEVGTKTHPANKNILAGLYSRDVIHEKVWTEVRKVI